MEGTLNLDARQRAMLDEMGIKLFWPAAVSAAAPAAAPVAADAPSPRTAPEQAAAAPAPVSAPPIAARPSAVPSGASVLIDAPRLLYGSEAAAGSGWLIVADMPPELDGRHGEPFAGEAGRLFEAMLRALQLQLGAVPVHLMRTHRGVASGQPGSPRPIADAFAEAAPAAQVVLAMGPLAAQSLLQSTEPLGRLRGEPARIAVPGWEDVPVVVTYHPAYLLRNPADKGRAWVDLCLAAAQLPQS
ncbi:uracil-DNA glycosylase [Variovorax sp. WS11]|uniref:uracil-DNA glycosylase family protein n=1 Tax=Variovorax sp. WS11 TaxID=1105204 RepID=UPI000D0CCD43|nr:uracil-DNA glycosylase family protein [Variovorax sp. WS11]NDZ13315.1 uracil-DNA glycosylase [Variovorax sp. WS11]PSL79356.1 uracil-DNA glycosylase [Variovorax sp. WS11]